MKVLLYLVIALISFLSVQAQEYGWVDISGNVPKFPHDTTIINNGADTLLANFKDVFFS